MGSLARFISTLLTRHLSSSSSLSSLRRLLLRPFSSSSSSPPASDEFLSFFSGDRAGAGGESLVYRQYLQCHRPPTVKSRYLHRNSCSFIGSVVFPMKICNTKDGSFGVYTLLEVNSPARRSSGHCSPFRIFVSMWGKLAEISYRHLKQDDFIYVWGHLCSYEKVDESGKREILHRVDVKDLSYVRQTDKKQTSQTLGKEDKAAHSSIEADREKECRDRLRLWQVFFANPYEWWDNRQGKAWLPHFKHKDTHECLSLSPSDPPWVRKQLELYDSAMARRGPKSLGGVQPGAFECIFED